MTRVDRHPEAGDVSESRLGARATYRLQLTPEFGFADGTGARPVPARPRHLASVPVAVVAGPARLDPRLRRDRPAAGVGASSAARPSCAPCRRAARDAGLGLVLDVVPNHMAVDDANRYWTDPALREKFFDIDPVDRRVPALLRHRRSRGRPPGGSGRCSRRRTRWSFALVSRGSDRRRPDRSSRRAGRSRRLPGPAALARGRPRVGREDPRCRRAAARLAGVRARSATSSSTTCARCSSTPPARTASHRCGTRSPATGARSTRSRSRPSSSRSAARSRRTSTACCASSAPATASSAARWNTPSPRCRSTVPTSSRSSGRVDPEDRRWIVRVRHGPHDRVDAAARARGAGRVRDAVSSRRRRRSWPRGSRTRRSTATAGCWR